MFRLNDNRQSEAIDPAGDTVSLEAAESLPVSAIFVEDAETGERLFPQTASGLSAGPSLSRGEERGFLVPSPRLGRAGAYATGARPPVDVERAEAASIWSLTMTPTGGRWLTGML